MRTIIVWCVVLTVLWFSRANGEDRFVANISEDGQPLFVSNTAASAPTPYAEVVRVLSILPRPEVGFVDFGCGDGRWLFAAAERWPNAKIIGVEIDPARAFAVRERVRAAGLESRVTIITGDCLTTPVNADVGTAYLYPSLLDGLVPRVKEMKAFASYMHKPEGLPVTKTGDSWLYVRPVVQQPVVRHPVAVWNGVQYTGPLCDRVGCAMCAAIRQSIAAQVEQQRTRQQPAKAASGHFETRKYCNGKSCWFANVWVLD